MFESNLHQKSLEESTFEIWLEEGRSSKLGYKFLLIIWDDLEADFQPVYSSNREEITKYGSHGSSHERETLVAAYDLYSESRIDHPQ